MSEAFKLILPERKYEIAAQEAAILTAFAMFPNGHSASTVLQHIRDLESKVTRMSLGSNPNSFNNSVDSEWGSSVLIVSCFQKILETESNLSSEFCNAFKSHFNFLLQQFRAEKITLRDAKTNTPIHKDDRKILLTRAVLSLEDFKKVAQELGISVFLEDELNTSNNESAAKRVLASTVQDDAIKTMILQLGYQLLALPKNKAGKGGVKGQVKAALLSQNANMWQGKKFEIAWQRLRSRREIGESATV